jgi:hypothetical protein
MKTLWTTSCIVVLLASCAPSMSCRGGAIAEVGGEE